VVFLSETAQSDVYVADFDMKSEALSTPKRLTLDDRNDLATAWSPDSTAVLFVSTRNGTADIFKQNIHSDTAEPLVTGPGDQTNARVASGGRWLLYFDGLATPVRLMRVPVDGGAPQPVVAVSPEAGGFANRFQTVHLHCSVQGRCVMAERDGAGARVFSVDPGRGKGAELGRFPANVAAVTLSPDGESVAFVVPGDDGRRNHIRFMSFDGKAAPDLVIQQASWLSSLDGLASGSGFLSVDVAPAGAERRLLFIRPDGTSRVLWSERGLRLIWAIPSPDGKHIALNAQPVQRDVWMMTDF